MRVAVVIPVLDDWDALIRLIEALGQQPAPQDLSYHLIVVDDGSSFQPPVQAYALQPDGCIAAVDLITLGTNLGHQRAIAVGLVHASNSDQIDAVVVMDGDGEDRPDDIPRLLDAMRARPGTIILASRAKRHESVHFKSGYAAYRLMFRILIGREINFGNFSLHPIGAVQRLVYMPELWNNLPAAVLRSRIPHAAIPIDRGFRYAGHSKMNFISLVVHGLSALSVYLDTIFVRVLVASSGFALLTVLGIIAATAVRLTTNLVIPGWTTTAVGALLTLLVQTIVLMVATTLMVLAGRSTRPIVPRSDSAKFVRQIQSLWVRDRSLAGHSADLMSDPA